MSKQLIDTMYLLFSLIITVQFVLLGFLLLVVFVAFLVEICFGRKKNVSNKEDNAEVPAARVSLHKSKKH